MAGRHRSRPPWDFLPRRYKNPGSYGTTLQDGHNTDALVRHPLSPYWEKCGAMGCGILYRMVAEQIELCAMLATHRTGATRSQAALVSALLDGKVGAPHPVALIIDLMTMSCRRSM
jgi:hypothetical protein